MIHNSFFSLSPMVCFQYITSLQSTKKEELFSSEKEVETGVTSRLSSGVIKFKTQIKHSNTEILAIILSASVPPAKGTKSLEDGFVHYKSLPL